MLNWVYYGSYEMKKNLFYSIIILVTCIGVSSAHATINFHAEIYDLETEIDDLKGRERINAINRLVNLYENRSQQKVVKYYALLKDEYSKQGDMEGVAEALYGWGNYFYYAGLYDDALKIYEKLITHCTDNDLKLYLGRAYTFMGRVYDKRAYYQTAGGYYEKSFQIKKSLKSSIAIKAKLQEQQKESQERQIRLEKKLNNLYKILAAIAGCLMIYSIFRGFRHYHMELARKSEKNRMLRIESKLKLYQARINPHFLFNSLDSIIQIGQDNDPLKLKQTLLKLSDLYRNLLAVPDLQVVEVFRELELVTNYLDIERLVSKGRINYTIDLPETLRLKKVIPLCILTLVENAVKHGLASKVSGGKIDVIVEKKEGIILIHVIDDGGNFDLIQINQGFGLYSIQKRLELQYRGKGFFNIKQTKNKSTKATIGIPDESR